MMADDNLDDEKRTLLLLRDNLHREADECEDELAASLLILLVRVCDAVFTTMDDMEDS